MFPFFGIISVSGSVLTFSALLFDSVALPLRENVFPGKVLCVSNRRGGGLGNSYPDLDPLQKDANPRVHKAVPVHLWSICLGASQVFAESRSSPPPPAAPPRVLSAQPGAATPGLEVMPRGHRALPPAALRRGKLFRLESRRGDPRAAGCEVQTGSGSSVVAAGAG